MRHCGVARALSVLVLLLASSGVAAAAPVALELVKQRSSLEFIVYQSTGKTRGSVRSWDGEFSLDADDPAHGVAQVVIDVASIDTGIGLRDEHLQEERFFHVERYPEIRFEAQSFILKKPGTIVVKGALTVKGKRSQVSIPLDVTPGSRGSGGQWRVKGWTQLNMKEIGLDFKAPWYSPAFKPHVDVVVDAFLREKKR